jgi:hypothetical protein
MFCQGRISKKSFRCVSHSSQHWMCKIWKRISRDSQWLCVARNNKVLLHRFAPRERRRVDDDAQNDGQHGGNEIANCVRFLQQPISKKWPLARYWIKNTCWFHLGRRCDLCRWVVPCLGAVQHVSGTTNIISIGIRIALSNLLFLLIRYCFRHREISRLEFISPETGSHEMCHTRHQAV